MRRTCPGLSWDRIIPCEWPAKGDIEMAQKPHEVPVPEWHKRILEERLANYADPSDVTIPWDEASAWLRKKLRRPLGAQHHG
ncbi:MAG: addiction module protein [Dehalococcoidia bacterium]